MHLMRIDILGTCVVRANERVSAEYKGHCLAARFYVSSVCFTSNDGFVLVESSVSLGHKHGQIHFLILLSEHFQFHMNALLPAKIPLLNK